MATDNMKFWTILASAILAVSILVMLIDMSIKAGILAEADALRTLIESQGHGRSRQEKGTSFGAYRHDSDAPDLLDFHATGMENRDVPDGDSPSAPNPRKAGKPKPEDSDRDGEIPEGN